MCARVCGGMNWALSRECVRGEWVICVQGRDMCSGTWVYVLKVWYMVRDVGICAQSVVYGQGRGYMCSKCGMWSGTWVYVLKGVVCGQGRGYVCKGVVCVQGCGDYVFKSARCVQGCVVA
jgi:hypothetical protein